METNSYLSEYNKSNFAIKMNNIPPAHMPSKGGDKELVAVQPVLLITTFTSCTVTDISCKSVTTHPTDEKETSRNPSVSVS